MKFWRIAAFLGLYSLLAFKLSDAEVPLVIVGLAGAITALGAAYGWRDK